jgi:hypothetical protein
LFERCGCYIILGDRLNPKINIPLTLAHLAFGGADECAGGGGSGGRYSGGCIRDVWQFAPAPTPKFAAAAAAAIAAKNEWDGGGGGGVCESDGINIVPSHIHSNVAAIKRVRCHSARFFGIE